MLLMSLDEAFDVKNEKEVTIGVEMELYIVDACDDRYVLLNDNDVIEEIYKEFDERVYRDYYSYQLEIRTNPSDDWKEVANELIELMRTASKVANERSCYVVPVSFLKGAMFNGMHVHISYRPEMSFDSMVEHAFAMYPFMLDLTRLTLSAPYRDRKFGEILSIRQLESPHIGVPPLHYSLLELEDYWIFSEDARSYNRYHDIIINTNRKEGRHRIKSVDTIEVRMFDCVGSEKYIKAILESVWKIAKFIKPNWFWKYHYNYSFMVKLRNLIKNSKIMLVKPDDWLNPLTMYKVSELLNYLGVENQVEYPWIFYSPLLMEELHKPEAHKDVRYPLS